jgi:tRNA A37 methylthiotransferase MiaB
MCDFAETFGFDRINVFGYSDEEGTTAFAMEEKVDADTIQERALKLGEIGAYCEEQSLRALIGREIELVIDGESDEHEYLLSARALNWAPEIDGEIYVNDSEIDGDLEFGVIYNAKVTEIAGFKLLATVTGHAER